MPRPTLTKSGAMFHETLPPTMLLKKPDEVLTAPKPPKLVFTKVSTASKAIVAFMNDKRCHVGDHSTAGALTYWKTFPVTLLPALFLRGPMLTTLSSLK